ncbi:MAG: radical SAM protein [Candidatus Paceibacterota bacterium]|jgi:hypothetical protein
MKIDLKNPGHIKLLLLSEGVNFNEHVLLGVGKQFSENRYYYNVSNDPELFKYNLPSEILLPQNIESSIYYNKDSRLSLRIQGDILHLFYEEKILFPVSFNDRPNFFSKDLKNGIECKKVISMYGRYVLAFFTDSSCIYFEKGMPCKFCSLKPSRRTFGKDNEKVITPEMAKEASEIAVQTDTERIKYVMYTAGTPGNIDKGYEQQIEMIEKVKPSFSNDVKHHLTIIPTTNKKLLEKINKAGLDSIAFDIEVFDKKLFTKYCPGKSTFIGHDGFIESLKLARSVFGHSNVKVGFVGGLEPIESLKEGMEFFGKLGISIAINVFHPDKNTELEYKTRPSIDFLFEMVKFQSEVYKKYNLIPVFPFGGRRSSLDTEVYRGFFD